MKNIIISGVPRAGKTTLSRKINAIYPNYHIINGDAVRYAFQKALPKNEINEYGGKGMKQDFAKFLFYLLKSETGEAQGYYQYIIETCDISIKNATKFFAADNIILFLGIAELTPQEILARCREHDTKKEWTTESTDEQILKYATDWISKSKYYKRECPKRGFWYIDTSYDRDKKLEEVVRMLQNEKGFYGNI